MKKQADTEAQAEPSTQRPNEGEKEPEARQKQCFVIGPIGEAGSESRDHADLLLEFIIEPVLTTEPFNYKVWRADTLRESGMITNQIVKHLIEDDLVIADLSFENANAFYELAVRHGIRKPFIHLHRKGMRPPFDITTNRSIEFDLKDLRSVSNAKFELEAHVSNILSGKMPDSPLSFTIELSSNPEDSQSLLEQRVLNALNALGNQISNMSPQVERSGRVSSKYFDRIVTNSKSAYDLVRTVSAELNTIAMEDLPDTYVVTINKCKGRLTRLEEFIGAIAIDVSRIL